MTQQMSPGITAGSVIEFFENKEVVCGVCLAAKNQRLNVLTEHNREIGLSGNRVIHVGTRHLDMHTD
ncbi:MAG: hypothetical protein HGA84_02410, partial [Syntrophobacteraceae bacterium]|nr:hypothetical protein [Syntrophobacteraceae bacterium]